MDNELNDEWINNFEKTDKLYQDFYKDDLYYVNLNFVYVNRENEIEKINQESFLMSSPNYISREEIIQILKGSSIDNNKRYSLLSILKYNITLDADEIKNFLLYSNEERNFLNIVNQKIFLLEDIAKLIDNSWSVKKSLSKKINNKKIQKIYNESIRNGCLGGKVLGAGGGGFLLVMVKKNRIKNFIKNMKKYDNSLIISKFKFYIIQNIPFDF
jgi:hypothetical protein